MAVTVRASRRTRSRSEHVASGQGRCCRAALCASPHHGAIVDPCRDQCRISHSELNESLLPHRSEQDPPPRRRKGTRTGRSEVRGTPHIDGRRSIRDPLRFRTFDRYSCSISTRTAAKSRASARRRTTSTRSPPAKQNRPHEKFGMRRTRSQRLRTHRPRVRTQRRAFVRSHPAWSSLQR